jgi:hypothetical protein
MKIVWTCDFRAVSKAIQEAAEPRKFGYPRKAGQLGVGHVR